MANKKNLIHKYCWYNLKKRVRVAYVILQFHMIHLILQRSRMMSNTILYVSSSGAHLGGGGLKTGKRNSVLILFFYDSIELNQAIKNMGKGEYISSCVLYLFVLLITYIVILVKLSIQRLEKETLSIKRPGEISQIEIFNLNL